MENKRIKSLLAPPTFKGRFLNERDVLNRMHGIEGSYGTYHKKEKIEKAASTSGPILEDGEYFSNSPESGKGSKVNIGGTVLEITDGYGKRTFDGRKGEHSTGVDYTTTSKKAVAITDFIIQDVRLQNVSDIYNASQDELDKAGRVIDPTEGASAGWYVIGMNADGTRSQYMHLDPMTSSEALALKGKSFKRGEEIWGYGTGSGSSTGPHVKYRVYNGSSGSRGHINPLKYVFN